MECLNYSNVNMMRLQFDAEKVKRGKSENCVIGIFSLFGLFSIVVANIH